MRAGVLVVGLVLIVLAPAQGYGGGGGGGHGGGHSGGHFGGHGFLFGGHHGRGKAGKKARGGFWKGDSGSAVRRMDGVPRITTIAGFGSLPGLRVGFIADSFFCPLTPHLISPACPVCSFPGPFGFHHRFFGFGGSGFFGDDGFWSGSDDEWLQPVVQTPNGGAGRKLPVLVFTNGWSFEVTDYGIDDDGELRYLTSYGGLNIVPIDSLDFYATVKANEELGISFTLKLLHQH